MRVGVVETKKNILWWVFLAKKCSLSKLAEDHGREPVGIYVSAAIEVIQDNSFKTLT